MINGVFFWPQSFLIILKPEDYLGLDYVLYTTQQWLALCFVLLLSLVHLSFVEWRNLRTTLGFVYHPISLSRPGEFFFPGFLWLYLGGLRDEKGGKKSPLVSALQKQHREPSCHPTWIKGPSVVAAELLTRCLTLGWGVGGGKGWGTGVSLA